MKRISMKVAIASTLLLSTVFGNVTVTNAAAAIEAVAATQKPAAVMTDNLFKYSLKKEVELPVTVTAGGFSYTLEKILIYETNSAAAQALIKKYGFTGTEKQKYFIWTKMTIVNKSNYVVQFGSKDLSEKWRLHFGGEAFVSMPAKFAEKVNNTEALWTWKLAPGKKLTSYQAYTYSGNFDWFVIWLDNKAASAEKYVVNPSR